MPLAVGTVWMWLETSLCSKTWEWVHSDHYRLTDFLIQDPHEEDSSAGRLFAYCTWSHHCIEPRCSVHSCKPSTSTVEAKGQKFKAILGYSGKPGYVRPCLKCLNVVLAGQCRESMEIKLFTFLDDLRFGRGFIHFFFLFFFFLNLCLYLHCAQIVYCVPRSLCSSLLFLCFGTRSHYTVRAGLELTPSWTSHVLGL